MEFKDDDFQAEITKQALYWQKVLALQDWNLDVRVARQWEMSDPLVLAETEWYLSRKDAVIRLLHPSDLGGLATRFIKGEEADYDISLVHELLYLHFAPFDKQEGDAIYHEQAINAISRGMVRLYRSSVQPDSQAQATDSLGHYL